MSADEVEDPYVKTQLLLLAGTKTTKEAQAGPGTAGRARSSQDSQKTPGRSGRADLPQPGEELEDDRRTGAVGSQLTSGKTDPMGGWQKVKTGA